MVTFTVAPSSSSILNMLEVLGDKFDKGTMRSEVLAEGKSFVGA